MTVYECQRNSCALRCEPWLSLMLTTPVANKKLPKLPKLLDYGRETDAEKREMRDGECEI